jgi:ABC-type lipoprotein release transport system permease subunit
MLIWLIFVAPAIYLSYGSISTDLVTFLLLLINIVVAVPFLLAMIMAVHERKRH